MGKVYCQPMLLLVVVSQCHTRLVVRCYDFDSGEVREAERPDVAADAALIEDFRVTSKCYNTPTAGIKDIPQRKYS